MVSIGSCEIVGSCGVTGSNPSALYVETTRYKTLRYNDCKKKRTTELDLVTHSGPQRDVERYDDEFKHSAIVENLLT